MAQSVQPLGRANGPRALLGGQGEQLPRNPEAPAHTRLKVDQVVSKGESAPYVPLYVEIVIYEGFAEGQLARRPEQSTQRTGVFQDHREPPGLPLFLFQGAAVPKPDGEIARMEASKEVPEYGHAFSPDSIGSFYQQLRQGHLLPRLPEKDIA
jgi:hypothetical protein